MDRKRERPANFYRYWEKAMQRLGASRQEARAAITAFKAGREERAAERERERER